MTTELLFREAKIIQAREGTYGTDAIDLANNLAVARRYEAYTSVQVTHNGDFRERAIVRPSFSNNRGQFMRKNQTWAIEGLLPAPATAGDAPLGLADLFIASGMAEALVDNTTATYTLSTTATAGLTLYHYMRHVDSYVWRMTYGLGVRGNTVISGSVRDYATFTFTGESTIYPYTTTGNALYKGWSRDLAFFDTDGTILLDKMGAGISYSGVESMDDPVGLLLEPDSVLTIDSVAFPISQFTLDFGNVVKVKEATSSVEEVAGVWITGRNVTLNVTLEQSGTAFEKALDLLLARSEVAATLVLTDGMGTGGTKVTITMGDLQVRNVEGPGDAEGLANWTIPLQANADWSNELGDNEMTIVWSVT
jgi:hypothetical protein